MSAEQASPVASLPMFCLGSTIQYPQRLGSTTPDFFHWCLDRGVHGWLLASPRTPGTMPHCPAKRAQAGPTQYLHDGCPVLQLLYLWPMAPLHPCYQRFVVHAQPWCHTPLGHSQERSLASLILCNNEFNEQSSSDNPDTVTSGGTQWITFPDKAYQILQNKREHLDVADRFPANLTPVEQPYC